jgi:ribosome-associated protein
MLYERPHEVSMSEKRAGTTRKTAAKASKPASTPKKKTSGKTGRKTAKRASESRAKPAGKTARTKAAGTRKAQLKPTLQQVVLGALADMKAIDVKTLDVRQLTDVTDTMVVASGTSSRHVTSIADRVLQRCREAGYRPLGVEGEQDGEWVLLDLYDLVLHVMQPRVRDFYALEKLWEGGGAAA